MAIDRDETLRKAEKLLRQGNLAAAITEYARVASAYPGDVTTLNRLGDLYQRAGQTSDAVAQYARVADHWLREGSYEQAATHCKKILKLKPDDEPALLQLIQACIRKGNLAEAKTHLLTARDRREARGDRPGADELTLQLADLDPSDFDARLMGLRVRLARDPSRGMVADVRKVIAELERQGRDAETEDLYASLIRLDPDNVDARMLVAQAAMRRGDEAGARAAMPSNPEESQRPEVAALAAELELRAGQIDTGRVLLQRWLTLGGTRARDEIAALGERLRGLRPSAAIDASQGEAGGTGAVAVSDDLAMTYACVDTVVEDQASSREFAEAAQSLERFLAGAPRHVPALMRLVEVSIDGDLEPQATSASGRLADAYLDEGEALKARVIAEDLLSRDPQSRTERQRLRRALIALGDEDPRATIAEFITLQLGLSDEVVGDLDNDDALDAMEASGGLPAEAATVGGVLPSDALARDAQVVDASAGVVTAGEALAGEGLGADDLPVHGFAAQGLTRDRQAADAAEGFAESHHNAYLHAFPAAHEDAVGDAVGSFDAQAAAGAFETGGYHADAAAAEQVQDVPHHAAIEAVTETAAESFADLVPDSLATEQGAGAFHAAFDSPPSMDIEEPDFAPASLLEPLAEFPLPASAIEPLAPEAVSPDGHSGEVQAAGAHEAGFPEAGSDTGFQDATRALAGSDDEDELDLGDLGEIDLTGALNALSQNGAGSDAAETGASHASHAGGAAGAGSGVAVPAQMAAEARDTASHVNGAPADAVGPGVAFEGDDLEQVFDGLRSQAAGDMVEMAQPDQSARLLSMADTYQAAGMLEEARAALEQVATDSRHRFRAAAALGQLFWQQGNADAALRWLELASEAPAPDRDAGRALMYELAERLEQTGESTRALAVFLDLLAEQGDYRDVQSRVDRLTRVQAER